MVHCKCACLGHRLSASPRGVNVHSPRGGARLAVPEQVTHCMVSLEEDSPSFASLARHTKTLDAKFKLIVGQTNGYLHSYTSELYAHDMSVQTNQCFSMYSRVNVYGCLANHWKYYPEPFQ